MSAKASSKKPKKAAPKKGTGAKTWVRTEADQPLEKRPRTEKAKPEAAASKPEPPKKRKAKAKAEETPRNAAESKAAPKHPTGDGDELVVFAIRLRRSERDEIHEAAGSGKASRFVKAVALAAARRDAKALETAIREAEATRSS